MVCKYQVSVVLSVLEDRGGRSRKRVKYSFHEDKLPIWLQKPADIEKCLL
jgi:hypothetical protein